MGRVAATSTTRRWEGSRRVSEEDISLLFILSHLSAARLRKSLAPSSACLRRWPRSGLLGQGRAKGRPCVCKHGWR